MTSTLNWLGNEKTAKENFKNYGRIVGIDA